MIVRKSPLLLLILMSILFSGCSNRIGYGLVNWSIPEHSLFAGDIVPVYVQSNIGQVYVIGVGSQNANRIEIPLWQLSLYKSRSKAQKAAKEREEYKSTYAFAKVDGLPIRSTADNTSRIVYRLRQGETLKIIREIQGVPVLMGSAPLEGGWFEVMTDDGSMGACFSYNLNFFDEQDQTRGTAEVLPDGPDLVLDSLLSRSWYPDSYRTMLLNNQIDLATIHPSWGFYAGSTTNIARIELNNTVVSFPYTHITRSDNGLYRFEGSSLTVQVRRQTQIMVQYTDDQGMPQALFFSNLDVSPAEMIHQETQRRDRVFNELFGFGPRFSSGNYGLLQLLSGSRFLWTGYQLLSPSIIPLQAGAQGSVSIRYFLSSQLASEYSGVLTLTFDTTSDEINFLYAIENNGLRLEYVSNSAIKDAVVQSRNLNPTVLFFTKDSGGI